MPKLFISYSWTDSTHEAWVLKLGTDLREAGIDVILDKWDLKEGHDAYAFMERMVTDPEVKKVVLICNKAYAEKANARSGGVGTETQIISPEIYSNQNQDKFVAVITERGDSGKPYLPAYYKSRIFIDMTDFASSLDSFEQLVRWSYDQPIHKKPELGTKPSYLVEEQGGVVLATSMRQRRAVDALRNAKPNAMPSVVEYFSCFALELEKIRLTEKTEPFDDLVWNSIEHFTPYRNEIIELLDVLITYRPQEDSWDSIHRFFESLIPYLDRPMNVNNWRSGDFDNFRFVIWELFLYAVACLLKHEEFEGVATLTRSDYFVARRLEMGSGSTVPYQHFFQPLEELDRRNQRLNLGRMSLQADLLKQRSFDSIVDFEALMQADFVLYLKGRLSSPQVYWWPVSLIYVQHASGPFEIFARASSRKYFEKLKKILGVDGREKLTKFLGDVQKKNEHVPSWGFHSLVPAALTGYEKLATKE